MSAARSAPLSPLASWRQRRGSRRGSSAEVSYATTSGVGAAPDRAAQELTSEETAPPSRRPRRGRNRGGDRPRRSRSDLRVALLFLLPALFGFVVFYLFPAFRGVYLSFTDWNLLSDPEFVGFGNYRRLVVDPLFYNALRVTGLYVLINIGIQTVVALGMAVLMDRLTRSMWVRGILLVPYLIPNVIVALLWLWMLDFQLGIGNELLVSLGFGRISFFGSTDWVIPTIAGVNIWRHMGYTALLIFAGLQTIPKDLYEAGSVDGANEWQMFWRITMPMLKPVMMMVLVITIVGSFQVFDTIAVTTQGGPINASRVIYYYIFQRAFQQFDMGYAATLSVALVVILIGVTALQMRLLRSDER
jgi:multiple sugar transport system permease protein